MRTTRLEERMISSLCYVFFDLLRLRLGSFLFRELLLLSLLSLLGGHGHCDYPSQDIRWMMVNALCHKFKSTPVH